jgi:hypothetical protein
LENFLKSIVPPGTPSSLAASSEPGNARFGAGCIL